MNFKLKIFISSICVLALIWLSLNSYLNFDKYDPSIKQFLDNPDKYNGMIASHKGDIVYDEEKMYLKSSDELILLDYKEKIPTAKFGYTLIKGIFRKDIEKQENYITVLEYWNNDYNYVKYIISFFALIYVMILFFKDWKLTIKGFVAKKR